MIKLLLSIFLVLTIYPFYTYTYASNIQTNGFPINFQIESQHWKEVNKIIPKMSKFTVIDVESGKSFDVQRRAGKHHADVQPLTRKDTKIMKNIYHGHWSWRRRAILILAKDRLITASMHGMPHGAGALQNGFPGHFCIHFIGSTTHKTERSDLSHQLMILKAAGKIDEYLVNATPNQVTDALMVFIKNGDKGLIKKVAISKQKNIEKQIKKLDQIDTIRWNRQATNKTDALIISYTVPVDLQMFIKEKGALKTRVSFQLMRTSPLTPWKVTIDSLLSEIEKK